MGHSSTLLICTDGALYLLCTRSPEMRHGPSASLFLKRPLRPLCVCVCVSHSATLGVQPGLGSSQSRQLSSPRLYYQPCFLETETTSRAQRRERHSQAGFGRMRAKGCCLLLREIHKREQLRAEPLRGALGSLPTFWP